MNRAYYAAPIQKFQRENSLAILGALADHHEFGLEDQQKFAWKVEIEILKHALGIISG